MTQAECGYVKIRKPHTVHFTQCVVFPWRKRKKKASWQQLLFVFFLVFCKLISLLLPSAVSKVGATPDVLLVCLCTVEAEGFCK